MEMTPAERLLAAVNCKEPDFVPVQLILSPVYFRKWAFAVSGAVGEDRALRMKAELEFFRQWPAVVPLISGPAGQGAVGLRSWMDRRTLQSDIQPPSQHWSKKLVKEKLIKARVPDPYHEGWMPKALHDWQSFINDMPKEARSQYGGLIWTFQVPGPLVSVATLLSYPDVFRLLNEDPAFVHELLNFHTISAIPWIKAVEKVFIQSGLGPCRFFIEEEILPMLSSDHAREFCLPYLSQMYQASQSSFKIFHCDNRVTHLPSVVTDMGANVFFGNFSDYGVLKRVFGGKIALMGNVPSLHVLTRGSTRDVEECSRWLIEHCGPGGGFVLSSGGGLDPGGNTPLQNVIAMVDAAARYGRYPLTSTSNTPLIQYQSIMSLHFSRTRGKNPEQIEWSSDPISRQTCEGDESGVEEAVRQALEADIPPRRVFERLYRGLDFATGLFYEERFFHPEMEKADRAFKAGLNALGSSFSTEYYKGTVIIGSLKGSVQESGIRLIEVMLRGAGLNVINLGAGVHTEQLIEEAVNAKAQVIAMGVYFYEQAKLAEEVTYKLKEKGLAIKTLVGGMGITPEVARELAVDAYAADGREAQNKILELLNRQRN